MPAARPWTQTLAGRLAPTVAKLRSMNERFGVRPFRIFLVWLRWSGNERGAGTPSVLREVELTPAPDVRDGARLPFRFYAAGAGAAGGIYLSEVPLVFPDGRPVTFELLTGTDEFGGASLPPNVDFFYELRPITDAHPAVRCTLAGTPARNNERLEWGVELKNRDPGSPSEGPTAGTVF